MAEIPASSLFRLMDREYRIQRGNQFQFGYGRTDWGERCAASGAFNGSSPTANLVSIIKGQRKSEGIGSRK